MANFQILINTPSQNLTFRQGATVTLTGNILKDNQLFRPDRPGEIDPVHRPYSMVFGLRDDADVAIKTSIELRSANVFNSITGMVHFFFDLPILDSTGTQAVTIVVGFRLLVSGILRTISVKQPIFIQDSTSHDPASVAPGVPPSDEFGIQIASPKPLDPQNLIVAKDPFFVSGRTAIHDDNAWLYVLLYDKASGVVGDSFLAQNWLKSNLKRFSGELISPALPRTRLHILEAQVREKDGGRVVDSSSIEIEIKHQ